MLLEVRGPPSHGVVAIAFLHVCPLGPGVTARRRTGSSFGSDGSRAKRVKGSEGSFASSRAGPRVT